MDLHFPKVSCLCITWNRISMLRNVIQCFLEQTYPNKELLIVYELNDVATCKFAAEWDEKGDGERDGERNGEGDVVMKGKNVVFVPVPVKPVKLTLGALRNLSLMKATGEYVMQWDDDDWYSVRRIEHMMKNLKMSGKPVIFLNRWLLLDKVGKKVYFSHNRNWEGSILAKRDVLIRLGGYANKSKSEDTYLMKNIVNLGLSRNIFAPYLYIYVTHGNNTWDRKHMCSFMNRGIEIKNQVLVKLCMEAVSTEGDDKVSCKALSKNIKDIVVNECKKMRVKSLRLIRVYNM